MDTDSNPIRLSVVIRGAVQGVGFRPFIYRLATDMRLPGWVMNSSRGVFIEVEGPQACLLEFVLRIERDKPSLSFIQSLEHSYLDPVGYKSFEIRESDDSGDKTALVLPDISTCPDCVTDIFNPVNRRYQYPFTNCTNCGPRYSIIEALPYDRSRTTMKQFVMCEECRAEYEAPLNRRFHAQPNACPNCGPYLELWDEDGRVLATHHEALLQTAEAIRRGSVVAIKGLGGFHLMVDARSDAGVTALRQRKRREEKPLAVLYPSLSAVKEDADVSELEERLLVSPESPIVLLRKKAQPPTPISHAVAPENPYLGVMLPYTPLHHLLMAELGRPVVATSGNLSDEPICTDERESLQRLGGIADLFLIHNRPILRHVDDSIVRVMMGRELVLRRARGYAPLPIHIHRRIAFDPSMEGRPGSVLGVGAHLKNTVALSVGDDVFVSQHIGDLETSQSFEAFTKVIRSLGGLYDVNPASVACDHHPDYLSTKYARGMSIPVVPVQHHFAHVLSCMAENQLTGSALGISWDGTGHGMDGTIWGGEFLRVEGGSYSRVAHFRPFPLPGGEQSIKKPRRTAVGLLFELLGPEFSHMHDLSPLRTCELYEIDILRTMLTRRINSPLTSSVGRLFDAVASIIGLRQVARFEGQAAMELEFALSGNKVDNSYPFDLVESGCEVPVVVDWAKTVHAIIVDTRHRVAAGEIAAKFHNTLVETIVGVAHRVGEERVILTGGCFQNRYLTERAVSRLREEGFRPYWHQRIPPNDGGIALGQVVAAMSGV